MVKTSAVSTEGESWLHLPVGNGSEQTPSAGARRKDLGGSCLTKLVTADGRDCGSDGYFECKPFT